MYHILHNITSSNLYAVYIWNTNLIYIQERNSFSANQIISHTLLTIYIVHTLHILFNISYKNNTAFYYLLDLELLSVKYKLYTIL